MKWFSFFNKKQDSELHSGEMSQEIRDSAGTHDEPTKELADPEPIQDDSPTETADFESARNELSDKNNADEPEGYTEIHPKALELVEEGHALRAQGSFHKEASLECFDQAIAIDPDYALAWTCRGQVLNYLKRYAEALPSLAKSADLDPLDPDSWLSKAQAEEGLGMYEQAMHSIDKFLTLDLSYFTSWEIDDVKARILKLEEKINSAQTVPEAKDSGALAASMAGESGKTTACGFCNLTVSTDEAKVGLISGEKLLAEFETKIGKKHKFPPTHTNPNNGEPMYFACPMCLLEFEGTCTSCGSQANDLARVVLRAEETGKETEALLCPKCVVKLMSEGGSYGGVR